ncbi:hypothetical protein SDC9_106689 [bioreactor metagenome]|uniref:Uncharacterized protein n=1 Tax=bioreactor metagenome TaxID=1076179 RepID=A0A645B9N0_9ZZZZ
MLLHHQACVLQALGIGQRLVVHWVALAYHDQRGRQARQTLRHRGHGIGMHGVVGTAQKAVPALRPLAIGGFAGGGPQRRRAGAGVEHGREQYLSGQRRMVLIARHQAHACGQIATRLFARQIERRALARQPRAVLVAPLQHLVSDLQWTRKRVLRR